MAKLVIVSNRVILPRERSARAGGLALGVGYALRRYGGLWFGWSGKVEEETSTAPQIVSSGNVTYATINLGHDDHAQYYSGFSNTTLWPLFHYRLGILEFRRKDFEGYLRVNNTLAQALAPLVQADDLVWVHDYHLIPFGPKTRSRGVIPL